MSLATTLPLMEITAAAHHLLKARYLLAGETPEGMCARVAEAVMPGRAGPYCRMMEDLLFLPNSPALMNAGIPGGQLAACFVLPVEDSVRGIFRAVGWMARIHQSGGGTGFSFGGIRPSGDRAGKRGGVASGPLPFIRVFSEATAAIRQGGRRRGANMAVLPVSHPDIIAFARAKTGPGLENFNLSVGISADFFAALGTGREYPLVNPRNGEVTTEVPAGEIWEAICGAAWQGGDPGILFLDTINATNPVPGLGCIEATNPCGEQPLLPFESCILGSINLSRLVRRNELDLEQAGVLGRMATRFLDAMIDRNTYPFPRIRERSLLTRKIGLGVMGLADTLVLLGIPYGSREAQETAGRVMAVLHQNAREASYELAAESGAFPAFGMSILPDPLRNATVTTVAPTGSLHIIAGTSSGIEPLFSLAYERSIAGETFSFFHPVLADILSNRTDGDWLTALVRRSGSVQDLPLPADLVEVFRTATEIPAEEHLAMQAAVQRHVDNAVSKTVNLPFSATREDISRVFLAARERGAKGITVFRDRCREGQVIMRGCPACEIE